MGLVLVSILIALAVFVVVAPILALLRAGDARRSSQILGQRVVELEFKVRDLSEQLDRRADDRSGDNPPPGEPPPLRSEQAAAKPSRERESPAPRPEPDPADALRRRVHSIAKPSTEAESTAVPTQPDPTSPPKALPRPWPPDGPRPKRIDWEQFMGVRMFAWLGGLALFLAAAFFVKYSFDNNLISPELRVSIGFLVGVGLLIGGFRMSGKQYRVTSHTLSATGVVVLYSVTFACRVVYHFGFFGVIPTFLLMILITVIAFTVAVRFDAMVVAVLGMLGGFLTPILLSTGQDSPGALFSYIALLDLGLMAVAFVRRWNWLYLGGALGTVLLQAGWVLNHYEADKVFVAMAVFLGFDLLYLAMFYAATRKRESNRWLAAAAVLLPASTMAFVLLLIASPETGIRPGVLFAFLFGADACVLGLCALAPAFRRAHLVSGGAVFLLLSLWTGVRVDAALLYWALAGYLIFAGFHVSFAIWLQPRDASGRSSPWNHLPPVLALILVVAPILKIGDVSFVIWPAALLIDLLIIGLAVVTASLFAIALALAVTAGLAAVWVLRLPEEFVSIPEMLTVVGGVAVLFTLAGIFAARRFPDPSGGPKESIGASGLFSWNPLDQPALARQLPALSAILPFLLLILLTLKLAPANPSPIFGLALFLTALLLGAARVARMDWLPAVSLGCTFLLECAWHVRVIVSTAGFPDTNFAAHGHAIVVLIWYLTFHVVYTAFPFLFYPGDSRRFGAWAASAAAGPLQFLLVYSLIKSVWPNPVMGLIPALFAVPAIGAVAWLLKRIPADRERRNAVLASFGGVALLFITLIFPIQFERQWLTVAWALEGVALFWLFHRIPHPGLRYVGMALLTVSFIRLAFNPAVLAYFPRSETPILNWYLYAYGTVTTCLFLGAKLLTPPGHLLFRRDGRPWLCGMGVVLAFLLVNIEIADFFSEPGQRVLAFSFSGNFARDMTYSIAWALFALGLMTFGILRRTRGARYAGIGLLGVTLLKLFLHDLRSLDQLYRVGALVVVAVIAIAASFLYQKFLAGPSEPSTGERRE